MSCEEAELKADLMHYIYPVICRTIEIPQCPRFHEATCTCCSNVHNAPFKLAFPISG